MKTFGQFEQCLTERWQRLGRAAQFLGTSDRERLYLGAGALIVAPEPEEITDILDRETQIVGIGDTPEGVNIGPRHN